MVEGRNRFCFLFMAHPDGAYKLNGMDHMFLVTGEVVLSSSLMGAILIRSECSEAYGTKMSSC